MLSLQAKCPMAVTASRLSQLPMAGGAFWFDAMLGRPKHCLSPPLATSLHLRSLEHNRKGRGYRRRWYISEAAQ